MVADSQAQAHTVHASTAANAVPVKAVRGHAGPGHSAGVTGGARGIAAAFAANGGFVRTAALESLDDLGPDYLWAMEVSIPLRRLGSIGDIASAALFLASGETAYFTGQTMVIDGGQTVPESLEAMG